MAYVYPIRGKRLLDKHRIGCIECELPRFLKNSRSIMALDKFHNARPFRNNLCLFRAIAVQEANFQQVNTAIERHTVKLFYKYARHIDMQDPNHSTFKGISLDELSQVEEALGWDINVWTIKQRPKPKLSSRFSQDHVEPINETTSDEFDSGDAGEAMILREERKRQLKRRKGKKSKQIRMDESHCEAVESSSDISVDSEFENLMNQPNTWREYMQKIMQQPDREPGLSRLQTPSITSETELSDTETLSIGPENLHKAIPITKTRSLPEDDFKNVEYTWDLFEEPATESVNLQVIDEHMDEVINSVAHSIQGVEMETYAICIRESLGRFRKKIFLNLHQQHFSLIVRPQTFADKFECSKCKMCFEHRSWWLRHTRQCKGSITYKFVQGAEMPPASLFEKLDDIGISVPQNKRFYPYRICYDNETWSSAHRPEFRGYFCRPDDVQVAAEDPKQTLADQPVLQPFIEEISTKSESSDGGICQSIRIYQNEQGWVQLSKAFRFHASQQRIEFKVHFYVVLWLDGQLTERETSESPYQICEPKEVDNIANEKFCQVFVEKELAASMLHKHDLVLMAVRYHLVPCRLLISATLFPASIACATNIGGFSEKFGQSFQVPICFICENTGNLDKDITKLCRDFYSFIVEAATRAKYLLDLDSDYIAVEEKLNGRIKAAKEAKKNSKTLVRQVYKLGEEIFALEREIYNVYKKLSKTLVPLSDRSIYLEFSQKTQLLQTSLKSKQCQYDEIYKVAQLTLVKFYELPSCKTLLLEFQSWKAQVPCLGWCSSSFDIHSMKK